ncbi:helix-turn-helix domain-containing protein [Pseudoflavitalea sp. G-6-1-2]|uniref:helix-turn-helix domain-containing protein n=1 Tax=Pseudoflavitalea sp. G-6-1-2 TaxID=2728841 RepID=UPI00146B4E93|nr:AraC family transcriptional regulator [Pseudoflavitalea sp. G-6-1-2]NML23012.1 helix-turn-helix domain-containing protein [Pseudoflavitalea sp. G-6-1-2]
MKCSIGTNFVLLALNMPFQKIDKDLDLENQINESIAYFPIAGASTISNFRAPDSFVFIFFEAAKGWHEIDFTKYPHGNNQIHISFPGQIHSWDTQPGARGHKLILSKSYIEQMLPLTKFIGIRSNNFPVIELLSKTAAKLSREFELLREEIEDPEKKYSNIIHLRVQIILDFISEEMDIRQEHENKNIHPAIPAFLQQIDQHFLKEKSVSFYAEKLALTSNYLTTLTRQYLGASAKELIDIRLVLEAKRLLLGTQKSVKEIGYTLGFKETLAFTAFLTKKIGKAPSDFRNQHNTVYRAGQ